MPAIFEILEEQRTIKKQIIRPFSLAMNGVNVVQDVKDFVKEYDRGKERMAEGDTRGAEAHWRMAGRVLSQLSYLHPPRQASKASQSSGLSSREPSKMGVL